MHSCQLIAVDIDGTLLDNEHRITARTKATLQEAAGRGVVLTLSTGRMFISAQAIAAELGIEGPLIAYNGAMIRHAVTGEDYFHRPIGLAAARWIIDRLLVSDLHFHVYINEQLFVRQLNELTRQYGRKTGILPLLILETALPLREEPTKLLIMGEADRLREFAEQVKAELGAAVNLSTSHPQYLEIVHGDVSKGRALERIAAFHGIPRENVLAIGDNYNDLEMIRYAGLGIAMGNAPDGVKQEADYVAPGNDADGVADAIERFVLNAGN